MNGVTVKVYGLEELCKRIEAANTKLAAIESTLQRLPETQAAVFIRMWEEYQAAQLQGLKSSDLWTIAPPDGR